MHSVYKLVDDLSGLGPQEEDVYVGSLNGNEDSNFVVTNRSEPLPDKFGSIYKIYSVTGTFLASVRYDIAKKISGVLETRGSKFWIKDNRIHREDGPAHIDIDGNKYYFINGLALSFETFMEAQKDTDNYNKVFAETFGEDNE